MQPANRMFCLRDLGLLRRIRMQSTSTLRPATARDRLSPDLTHLSSRPGDPRTVKRRKLSWVDRSRTVWPRRETACRKQQCFSRPGPRSKVWRRCSAAHILSLRFATSTESLKLAGFAAKLLPYGSCGNQLHRLQQLTTAPGLVHAVCEGSVAVSSGQRAAQHDSLGPGSLQRDGRSHQEPDLASTARLPSGSPTREAAIESPS